MPRDTIPEACGDTLKETYPLECVGCGKPLAAGPSIMMLAFGINEGHGSCTCGQFMHLEIDPTGEHMIAEDWNEWSARELHNHHAQGGGKHS